MALISLRFALFDLIFSTRWMCPLAAASINIQRDPFTGPWASVSWQPRVSGSCGPLCCGHQASSSTHAIPPHVGGWPSCCPRQGRAGRDRDCLPRPDKLPFPPRSGPPLCVTRLIGIRDRSLSPYRLELGTQMTSSQKTKKIYHHHQAVRHGNIRRPHYSFSKATSIVPTSTH